MTARSLTGFIFSFALVMALNGLALAQAITLSGTATQGTGMIGATVTAYAVNPTDGSNGATLGSTTTGSNGTFAVSLTAAPASPVRLTASGGSFVSPANGATISTPSNISVLLADVTGSVSDLSINPLTDFINSLTVGRLTHTNIDLTGALTAATSTIERFYSLQSDPAGLIPDYSLSGVGTAAGNLALVLGGLAVEDQYLCPTAPGGLVTALSADIGDNAFDGTNFRTPITYCGGDLAAISGISAFQDALSGLNQIQLVTSAFSFGGPGNLLSGIPGYQPGAAFMAVAGIDSHVGLAAPKSINEFVLPQNVGSPTVGVDRATATLLRSGKVLIAGGAGGPGYSPTNVTELYDPLTRSFTEGPPLNFARQGHTATLLRNGNVLIIGGTSDPSATDLKTPLASTEIYNPTSNTMILGPNMLYARYFHTATLLADGRVFIDGSHDHGIITTTEIYNPATNGFSPGPNDLDASFDATATLLPSGRVLIAGGDDGSGNGEGETRMYDPVSNTLTHGPLMHDRTGATATLLPNGRVLIAGGGAYIDWDGLGDNSIILSSTDIYDPLSNTFESNTPSMQQTRYQATATLLPNGKVLIAGGSYYYNYNSGSAVATTEIYDPVTNTFASSTPSMNDARAAASAVLLPQGKVLIVGGYEGSYGVGGAELYWP